MEENERKKRKKRKVSLTVFARPAIVLSICTAQVMFARSDIKSYLLTISNTLVCV